MFERATDHLEELQLHFAGQVVTRNKVREYCKERGWSNADDAFLCPWPTVAVLREASASVALDRDPMAMTLSEPQGHRPLCPPSPLPVALPLELETMDPVMVLSDLHIPAHSGKFIDRAVAKAHAEGVRSFIIAGDITDNNQVHQKRGLYRQERSWQQDMDLARSVIHHLCAQFPNPTIDAVTARPEPYRKNIVFFGNHDEWVMNLTKGQCTTDWLYKFIFPFEGLHWTYKRQVRLVQGGHVGGARFMIAHGESFSAANPMGVVEKYALNNRCSVIIGHMHYAAQWESGPYQLILNGGCFDPAVQDYIHEAPKPYRKTQQGFTIIKDGYAKLYAGSDPTW